MAAIESGGRATRSRRILVSIKDQRPDDIGEYAGWGGREDQVARPPRDRYGPSVLPFRYGTNPWGRTLGCLYLPAVVVLLTIELDVLHMPDAAGWVSMVGLFVAFILFGRWLDRRRA
jgi:hypothetical protein